MARKSKKDEIRSAPPRQPVSPGAPSLAAAAKGPAPVHVYRWDLDKTYLKTEFDTFMQMWRSAFETAEEKQSIPGAAAILRELRAGGAGRICFISGSPRQMRRVLTRKLHLDGVEFDEFILKNNLRNMLTGRFRAMREQVGYKLPALLAGRAGIPAETRETCLGDDAEADGFIYSLYGDLLAGRVERPLLEQILQRAGCYDDDAQRAVSLVEALPRGRPAVQRIFIHLDRRSPTSRFDRYGSRLVPIYNYFQAALVLHEDGRLTAPQVVRIALEMVDRFDYTLDALRNSLADLVRRSRLSRSTVRVLGEQLAGSEVPALGERPETRALVEAFASGIASQSDSPTLPAPRDEVVDYLTAMEVDLPHRRKAKGG